MVIGEAVLFSRCTLEEKVKEHVHMHVFHNDLLQDNMRWPPIYNNLGKAAKGFFFSKSIRATALLHYFS
jgi:hypothetical protein